MAALGRIYIQIFLSENGNFRNPVSNILLIYFYVLYYRLLSDISRLEAKVERLEAQIQAKDREIATITRTVRNSLSCQIEVVLYV